MSKVINFEDIITSDVKVYLPNSSKYTKKQYINHKNIHINSEHFSNGKGCTINIMKMRFNQDTKMIPNKIEQKHSFLNFCLGGQIVAKENFKRFIFERNLCYHGAFIGDKTLESLYKKDENYLNVSIILEENIYKELFKKDKNKLVFQNDSFETYFNNQINLKQKRILDDILSNPFDDNTLNHIFLESKVLELLYESANINHKTKDIYLSQKDIICLNKAKDILLSNIQNPPSLDELAKLSALNRNKLNNGFKALFGNTVYKFLTIHRLEMARGYLQGGDINISEACRLVGYKHQRHFSKAFYEHFKEEAKEVKKKFWI